MPKILTPIPPAGFELVRDRIGEILIDEIQNQIALTYSADLEGLKIWLERSSAFGNAELPAINITLANGDYGNKHVGSIDGSYVFNIDFHANSKTIGPDQGDKLSAIKVQKLMRLCRSILENNIYVTLGFVPGFIARVFISNLRVATLEPDKDALNTAMTRLVFNVVLNETTSPVAPVLIGGYETHVKLSVTDQGYFYEGP